LVLTLIFVGNTLHESYPDEFDNISGGRFILRGIFPYSGFLAHHGPFAYYLSVVINIFSGVSFVHFRFVYTFFLVCLLYLYYRLIKNRFTDASNFLKPYFLVLGITATYFWLHMMLADSLSAFMLILPYFYLILLSLRNKKLDLKDIAIVSIPLAATLLTALTYSFMVAGLYLFLAVLWLRSRHKLLAQTSLKAIGIVLSPYLIFVFTLLSTGATRDYYFQNITYNEQYYIDNYPRAEGVTTINPLRYAVVVAKTSLNYITDGAGDVFRFNVYTPKEIPLLGMDLLLLIVFIATGNYLSLIPVMIMLLFSTPRSNLMSLKEIDYQSAVYIVLSLGSGMLLIAEMCKRKLLGTYKDVIISAATLLATLYLLIFVTAMLRPYADKTYNKFMGAAPTIYDRPEIAPAINLLVTKDEYAWIGPFAFEELYYMKAKLPSNYHWLLPANAKSEKIRVEMMADFNANKPKVIIFDSGFSAFGAPPSSFNYFMMDFINAHYTLLDKMADNQGNKYKCNIGKLKDFVCEGKFYLRNDLKDEMVDKMLKLNLAKLAQ
jgi:hypothetical protein